MVWRMSMVNIDELFWEANLDEMIQGYVYQEESEEYICLVCGESFEKGIIYSDEKQFFEAEKYMKKHIVAVHHSMFHYLINLNKKFTGLTEIQKEILQLFQQGLTDKEITAELGGGSTATIRNHRFKLKEKEKQAKVFLALMALLNQKNQDKKDFINIHKGATMVDNRFAITEADQEKVIKTYFDENQEKLNHFPRKEKRKIIILKIITKRFNKNVEYSEKEVNEVLKAIYDDFVTLRRYLIEYGFMDRNRDGSAYWVKN